MYKGIRRGKKKWEKERESLKDVWLEPSRC
jgi:hypothetical protein